MSDDEFHDQIKWAARLEHVREVSLLGTANLSYWMRQLEPEELFPIDYDGQAQIMIVGADSKFMGVPFREISFSVLVEPPDNRFGREAAYLIQAFNSSRFFAFCERTLFSTPSSYGGIMVSASHPVSIKLSGIHDSTFAPQQWAIRNDATHAKSKTYRRTAASWKSEGANE